MTDEGVYVCVGGGGTEINQKNGCMTNFNILIVLSKDLYS